MSALGQKQTFAVQYVMSALPPKADMCGAASWFSSSPLESRSLSQGWSWSLGMSGPLMLLEVQFDRFPS